MATKRKPLTKKLRFEVFKRDNFTCQYCGRMAPDVILEVDHVVPVAEGGNNDILNLVTSCKDCNRGKGKRKLSNKSELKLQQEQLKELAVKREQLQMMMEWREELLNLENSQIDAVESIFSRTGHGFSDVGRMTIGKLIKRYGLSTVCESMDVYIDKCYVGGRMGFSRNFDYIASVCYNKEKQKSDPNAYLVNKVAYYANRKYPTVPKAKIRALVSPLITCPEDCDGMLFAIEDSEDWGEFFKYIEEVSNG